LDEAGAAESTVVSLMGDHGAKESLLITKIDHFAESSSGQKQGNLKTEAVLAGWQLGEHATWAKMTNFEIGVHVPLIIRAPVRKRRSFALKRMISPRQARDKHRDTLKQDRFCRDCLLALASTQGRSQPQWIYIQRSHSWRGCQIHARPFQAALVSTGPLWCEKYFSAETPFFAPFSYEKRSFAKTGSGQT
jgi:hypothetical protein